MQIICENSLGSFSVAASSLPPTTRILRAPRLLTTLHRLSLIPDVGSIKPYMAQRYPQTLAMELGTMVQWKEGSARNSHSHSVDEPLRYLESSTISPHPL
ncbi:hypothetical protein FRB94_003619 [Tulasnella sp. JGI-2019a]|nr:hypothetical protein FRB94_003619 [Tulasnella sp. JGI-2019a]KAG9008909.1 hypothetical protein FRB93_005959 [Tulasnella sp. JGI-2019a]